MRFRLGPDVAIALGVRSKAPGEAMVGQELELLATRGIGVEMAAYERLLGDAMKGDPTLFAREDAVEAEWRIVAPILDHHDSAARVPARNLGTGRSRPAHRAPRRLGQTVRNEDRAMNVSPRAGKLAEASMLVNVPRLVTAYYTEEPDPSVPEQRVAFGTSGHRGSAFDKAFNEGHILAITQAICLYRRKQGIDGPLFLGMDTHALSEPALASALEVLAANGVDVMLARGDEYTPTPVVSHAILTHNRGRKTSLRRRHRHHALAQSAARRRVQVQPPERRAGGVRGHRMDRGEGERSFSRMLFEGVKRIPFERALRASTTHRHDYLDAYVTDLADVIDMDVLRAAKIRMGVDPLGGAGVHYWGPSRSATG